MEPVSDRVAPSVPAADDWLPLSGLQHLVYCERQCALIHVERTFLHDARTADGVLVHRNVDRVSERVRSAGERWTAVRVSSARLGVTGVADAVEVVRDAAGRVVSACPVETKRGRRTLRLADDVQVCAQAMALEELFGIVVREGAVYYASSRRRRVVSVSPELREATLAAARRFRAMFDAREVPVVPLGPRCVRCSLRELCRPELTGSPGAASRYVASLFSGDGPDGGFAT